MLRFAPSPTGDMHIGDLRVAILNYIISKQKNKDLLVRIDDTDKKNYKEGKDAEIADALALFGIEYSQIMNQSQNVRFHTAMALQLMHEKRAYSCFCSDEYLDKKRQEAKNKGIAYKYDDACENLPHELVIDNLNPFRIRIKKAKKDIIIKDSIKGDLTFKPNTMDSFEILHQDKTPTSNFACAIDDMLNDISLVIRDEKYLDNSPKQEHIRTSLGYDKKIDYAHIPSISNEEDFSIKELLQEGYLPSAIANYILLLGNETPKEIFSINEAIEWFDFKNLSSSPTSFDLDRLKAINNQHLKNLDAKELSRYVGFADDEIGKLAKIYLTDVTTTKELKSKIEPIFAKKEIPNEFKTQANALSDAIKSAPYFEKYEEFKTYTMEKSALDENEYTKVLCLVLTGSKECPDLAQIYKYLKNYLGKVVK